MKKPQWLRLSDEQMAEVREYAALFHRSIAAMLAYLVELGLAQLRTQKIGVSATIYPPMENRISRT